MDRFDEFQEKLKSYVEINKRDFYEWVRKDDQYMAFECATTIQALSDFAHSDDTGLDLDVVKFLHENAKEVASSFNLSFPGKVFGAETH